MDSPEPVAEVMPIFTPLNLILVSLAAYLVYMRFKPQVIPTYTPPEPILHRRYTPSTLKKYNGTDDKRILMAVRGTVFDVSSAPMFYGPGGPYNIFAGRDASRGLAKGVLDESLLTPVGKPVDTLEDLTGEEKEVLKGWFEQFEGKYLIVGEFVEEGLGDN